MMTIDDYQKAKNTLYTKYGADGFLLEPNNNEVVLKLLKNVIPESCDFDAVTSFCLQKNYGRGKANQDYQNPDGQKVKISSPEQLYDYIVSSSAEAVV